MTWPPRRSSSSWPSSWWWASPGGGWSLPRPSCGRRSRQSSASQSRLAFYCSTSKKGQKVFYHQNHHWHHFNHHCHQHQQKGSKKVSRMVSKKTTESSSLSPAKSLSLPGWSSWSLKLLRWWWRKWKSLWWQWQWWPNATEGSDLPTFKMPSSLVSLVLEQSNSLTFTFQKKFFGIHFCCLQLSPNSKSDTSWTKNKPRKSRVKTNISCVFSAISPSRWPKT